MNRCFTQSFKINQADVFMTTSQKLLNQRKALDFLSSQSRSQF